MASLRGVENDFKKRGGRIAVREGTAEAKQVWCGIGNLTTKIQVRGERVSPRFTWRRATDEAHLRQGALSTRWGKCPSRDALALTPIKTRRGR